MIDDVLSNYTLSIITVGEYSRDTVKATVFGSHIAAPTMTLEEYGDLQKIDAEARSRDSSQTPSQGALMSRRYDMLCICIWVTGMFRVDIA